MVLLIGVDIGTQGTKAALYTSEGRRLAEAFEASDIRRPAPGAVEEDADRQAASVLRTIASCVEQAGEAVSGSVATQVAAIAIDGQMAGVIGVDADGAAITPYDSWLDTRCAPQIAKMVARAGDRIVAQAGCAPSYNHGPKILWWRERHPDVFARVAAFVQPGGYAAMRLCGLTGSHAFIDTSYLHFSGFADTRNAQWDDELCTLFDLPASKLPRIMEPHEVVGRLTAEAARATGLREGVPVVAGCGDTAASFLSCGATHAGVCVDVAGTASVFAATVSEFRPDTKSRTLAVSRSAVPGLWHPYAYVNGGGMNLEWFRRELGGGDEVSMEDLDAAAGELGPENAPIFVPHLAGRVSPAMPNLRGAWVGLDWSHGAAHLYRSALEGVALEYGIYRDTLLELYPEFRIAEIRVTGGGERSSLWNQIKSSVLGAPVLTIEGSGGAPMGAAMLAGYGAGVWSDLEQGAATWVRAVPGAEPRASETGYYRTRVNRYRRLLAALNEFHGSEE